MDEATTGFVGLDAHAESTAIGFAELGRAAPRFVGTVGEKFAELTKALGKLGDPSELLIVYEAGPCRYALARELRRAGYGDVTLSIRCESQSPQETQPCARLRGQSVRHLTAKGHISRWMDWNS